MTITYFGYGSLVNAATLHRDGIDIVPGELTGWVREWRIWGTDRLGRGVCVLSVAPEPSMSIDGVMVREPKERLAGLEVREHKYHRICCIGEQFRCTDRGRPGPADMFLFRSRPEYFGWGDDAHPILLSYLDCVCAGFFQNWGEAGVRRFFQTTRGWHVPVLDDRDAPIYPRAVELTGRVRDIVDDLLIEYDVRILSSTERA